MQQCLHNWNLKMTPIDRMFMTNRFLSQIWLMRRHTLVIARSARIAEILLHSIETCAERYNLKLNTGKCEVIKMFASTDVHFRNGQPLKVVGPQGARYLGAQITPDGRSHREVGIRIGKATAGFKAVSAF